MIRSRKYKTGFSSASLLYKEAEATLPAITDAAALMVKQEKIDSVLIPVNSETSKKRLASELNKRIVNLQNEAFIHAYLSGSKTDKHLILFYAACKSYQLISDFMLEAVLSKWYNLDLELKTTDFQNFIYKKLDSHIELEKLKPLTVRKLSDTVMRMLRELGMLQDDKLKKVQFSVHVLKDIVRNGDSWFLEVLLFNPDERNEIIGQ